MRRGRGAAPPLSTPLFLRPSRAVDGETNLSFTEDVIKRYDAYGWHTQHVADGNEDLDGLLAAIERAKAVTGAAAAA